MDSALPKPTTTAQTRARALLGRALPLVSVAVFVIAVLYRLTLLGQALYWGDLFLYFYPLEAFVRESLRAGRIPLWNPYILCGQPLVGNPQAWVFYPSTALLSVLPVWLYFTVGTVLHVLLAGMGAYLYLRRRCGERLSALLGALTFAGSGFLIARLQFPPMVQSAAYLPWLLLLIDRMVDRPRVRDGALLALTVGLTLLAAHAQTAYLSFACGTAYALARLAQIRGHRTRAWTAFGGMAVALLLGVLSAAVQLLPALQLLPYTPREHLTWSEVNRFVFLPEHLLNFLYPTYYGHPARGDYWGAGNIWEPCVYVGLLPLLLAGYALFRASRRLAVRFFAMLGLVALWLAMGRYGGLYWLAYRLVPGIASFHDPARFTLLTTFALAALAAMGLRALRDRGVANRLRMAMVVVAAMDLWSFSAHFNPTLPPTALEHRPSALARMPKAGEGRVMPILEYEVWRRYVNYDDYGSMSDRYARELADTLIPNSAMRFGVEQGGGYEPVPVRAVMEVVEAVREGVYRQSPNLPLLLGLFNTHTILLPEGYRYPHPGLRPERARGTALFAVRDPFPRAWLVRQTRRVDGAARSLAAVSSPDFDPRGLAIVSGSPGLKHGSRGVREQGSRTTPMRLYSPASKDAFVADVDAGRAPGFLVWSATWYPGWQVEVDGVPARLERANHAFCGVVVPPGRHRVTFEYRPFIVRLGLYLSLVAAGLIACGLLHGFTVRTHRRRIP